MSRVSEMIELLKTKVNEENVKEVISEVTSRLSEKGKDADLHEFVYSDGSKITKKMRIGPNRIKKFFMSGTLSADSEFISNNIRISVTSGIMADIVDLTVDDCQEAYENLIWKIQKQDITSFEDIMKTVYSVVNDYFGGIEKVDPKERERYYHNLGDLEKDAILSDFKGKNLAACTERAALSQNLLQFLGFNSVFKSSIITNSKGKEEAHDYNLVEFDGKYYLYDATIPLKEKNGNVTPIISEISKEVFEKLSHSYKEDDVAIRTEHDSGRGYKRIVYNSWSENVYDTTPKEVNGHPSDDSCGSGER